MEKLNKVVEKLGLEPADNVSPFKDIGKKAKVRGAIIALGLISIVVCLVALEIGSIFLTAIFGFIYPAYMSFKAIESPGKDDDKQWLSNYFFSYFLILLSQKFYIFIISLLIVN